MNTSSHLHNNPHAADGAKEDEESLLVTVNHLAVPNYMMLTIARASHTPPCANQGYKARAELSIDIKLMSMPYNVRLFSLI